MKEISVIGIGMGEKTELSGESLRRIREAELLIGAGRMLEFSEGIRGAGSRMEQAYQAEEIRRLIEEAKEQKIVLLFSGDTGFYSGAEKVISVLKGAGYRVSVLPGASSLSMLCARLGKSWEKVHVMSLHGRKANVAYTVKTHTQTFFLTDGDIRGLAEHLTKYGLGTVRLSVGIRLSYPDEKILSGTAEEFAAEKEPVPERLVCVLVENEQAAEESGWFPDERFLRRPGIPMSKEAVRLFAAGSFPIQKGDILYDIGSGSGSVSAALAARVPEGTVYAVEKKEEAAELTEENARRFSMDQIVCIRGEAPQAFRNLPAPDGVFIGGSGGRLAEILEEIPGKRFWFLVTAVTLETLREIEALTKRQEISGFFVRQLAVSHMEERGSSHLFLAENPVYLAGGVLSREEEV